MDSDIPEFERNSMKNIIKILILFTAVVAVPFALKGQVRNFEKDKKITEREQEYYFAFTEATKFYLFGNYTQAIGLYRECLKIRPASAAVYYQLGRIFLISGNPSLAREFSKKAVLFDGKNTWYLQQLADLYQYEKKNDSAVIIYKSLLELKPDDLNTVYNLAVLHEKLNEYREAHKYLNAIENKIGISKEVSLAKFRMFEIEGKSEEALRYLRQAYDIGGKEYSIAGILAEFFNKYQQPDSADYYYRKIYPAYGSDPVVAFSYADYLMTENRYIEAEEVLMKVIKDTDIQQDVLTGFFYKIIQQETLFNRSKPLLDTIAGVFYKRYKNDIRVQAIYADIQIKLKKYGNATLALEEIVKSDKRNYPALEQLIYAYNLDENATKVVEFSRYGIEIFSDKPLLYLFGGAGHYRLKEYDEASALLEKGLPIAESNELKLEFLSMLAEVYEHLKLYDKSERAFMQALSIDPENNGLKNNFAYYLALRKENLKYAAKLSKATITSEPGNSTYLDTYGWVLFMNGKVKKAEKYIKKALNGGGQNNTEILLHYAEISISLGNREEAMIYLNKAREIAKGDEKDEILRKINILLNK